MICVALRALALYSLGLAPALATQSEDGPPTPPSPVDAVRFEQKLGDHVPLDLHVRTEDGSTQPIRSLTSERPIVFALVYYRCPNLCGMVLQDLFTALKAISLTAGEDYDVVLVSIDPGEAPTLAAAKKRNYVQRFAAPEHGAIWHFTCATAPVIERLATAIGYHYAYDEEFDQYAHPSGFVVLTPEGRISHYFLGIDYDPRSLRLALVESSAGTIGTPVDAILLRCFRFDPTTGKYTVPIWLAVRAFSILTFVVLGSVVVALLWRERRRRRAMAAAAGIEQSGGAS